MYSRPPRRDASMRVPENYSGNAFSERPMDLPPHYLDVAAPKREESHREEAHCVPPLPPPPPHDPPPQDPPAALPMIGLTFDQLLILGLILLLAREGTQNDTVICLSLLLLAA